MPYDARTGRFFDAESPPLGSQTGARLGGALSAPRTAPPPSMWSGGGLGGGFPTEASPRSTWMPNLIGAYQQARANRATPAIPAIPAIPGTSPATPATPAMPAGGWANSPGAVGGPDDGTNALAYAYRTSPEAMARRAATGQMVQDALGRAGSAVAGVQNRAAEPGVDAVPFADIFRGIIQGAGQNWADTQAGRAANLESLRPTGTVDPRVQALIGQYMSGSMPSQTNPTT